jgi:4-hydroxy-tetrahydrodipicolinate reductase
MESIKVFQIGCGKMSKYTMRYVYEHGARIVGAVDINPELYGMDIGMIMNTDYKNISVRPLNELERALKETKPDIAIITTMSLLNDLKNELRLCARLGINAITTCEEAFYGENSNPLIWKEIDVLAKANKCTITGCGYQDVFWGNLIATICGTTHKITKIKGSSSYNVEDYGIALANAHGAGLNMEDFEREIASKDKMSDEERANLINSGKYSPSYMWNAVGWLADRLNLHIKSMTQVCLPQTHVEDLESTTLGIKIKAGDATGMSALVTAETEEGIFLEAECVGKVYAPGEVDKNEWTVYGEPDTTITVNEPKTVELTCADIVNRIPDVINAEPGFIPTSRMPLATYKLKNLEEYIK